MHVSDAGRLHEIHRKAAPYSGRQHHTQEGSTILRKAAPHSGRLHHTQEGCTILRQAAPYSGRLHHTQEGCTTLRKAASYSDRYPPDTKSDFVSRITLASFHHSLCVVVINSGTKKRVT